MRIKHTLKSLLELISSAQKSEYGFFGNYPTWEAAQKDSTGYDTEVILEKVKDALLKIKKGEAVYERDSVLFDKIQYSWPVLAGLLWIASKNGNKLNLIDFGGSLGSTYFQNRRFLQDMEQLSWNIVEQERFVECGKKYFADGRLNFYYDLESCLKEQRPSIILFSGVLQYLEKPYELLRKIVSLDFECIIFDRISFIEQRGDRLTVQKVPPMIYEASYPSWFFNREEFLSMFKGRYELVAEFNAYVGNEYFIEDNIKAGDKGFIFKRLENA